MNRLQKMGLLFALILTTHSSLESAFAAFQYSDPASYNETQLQKPLTVQDLFVVYFNSIAEYESLPESYKYIKLQFKNVNEGTPVYAALQKGVYMNFIKNKNINLPLKQAATEDNLAKMVGANFSETLHFTKGKALTTQGVLQILEQLYSTEETAIGTTPVNSNYEITKASNFPILNDAYIKLKYNHIDSDKFTDEKLIQGAIKGMAEATEDKHTAYFPPTEAENFSQELSGQFEGIGAYVDMTKPGILEIVSPIAGTPAEKAGLKGGDIILKIDDFELTPDTTVQNAVSKIKGPTGTKVKLTIRRGTETLEISVTREKIVISFVEYKKLENNDSYIKITTFGEGSFSAFAQAMNAISKDSNTQRIILDLRNNPGGSLDEVALMLNYFVPKNESVVNVQYKNTSSSILSEGTSLTNIANKKIIILINEGSASASEIMAGTIKDYLPENTKVFGEKSYGKGSVQSLDSYWDSSSFKYTVAKWSTGKTKTQIDGAGIKPDVEVKFDETKWKQGIDNQLDYVKNYNF